MKQRKEREQKDDGKHHLIIAIGFLKHKPKQPNRGEPRYPKVAKDYVGDK